VVFLLQWIQTYVDNSWGIFINGYLECAEDHINSEEELAKQASFMFHRLRHTLSSYITAWRLVQRPRDDAEHISEESEQPCFDGLHEDMDATSGALSSARSRADASRSQGWHASLLEERFSQHTSILQPVRTVCRHRYQ
jgi:hypothetical protein